MSRVFYAAFDLVPSPKGASTHITYFTRGLVAAGHEVTLLTAGDSALPLEETYEGATLLRAPTDGDMNYLKRALEFGAYAVTQAQARGPFDIIHVRSIWSGYALLQNQALHGSSRLLYEVNGLPSIELKYHYPQIAGLPILDKIREWELATLRAADAIICPSRVTAEYIASLRVDRAKITVIPNGVEAERFDGAAAAQPQPAEATVLYIGTLADWQGLDILVQAMPLLLAERPVKVRLVGRGRKRQRKMLLKMARKLGVDEALSIEPARPHECMPDLLAAADICVAPLGYNDRNVTQGCCPIKVLEYMAAGRPLVAANLPVVRELMAHGEEGLLFIPEDPVDLARQILALLADPAAAAAMAQKAAEHVRAQYPWAAAQARLLQVYRQLEAYEN